MNEFPTAMAASVTSGSSDRSTRRSRRACKASERSEASVSALKQARKGVSCAAQASIGQAAQNGTHFARKDTEHGEAERSKPGHMSISDHGQH